MTTSETSIAVCYHSGKGHTAAIAKEVASGALSVNRVDAFVCDVTVKPIPWQRLFGCDAILFGCPTYFGGISAEMKAFLDETDAFWRDMRWRDKIAGGFTCAGDPSGDKLSALMGLSIFAAQHGMIWIGMDSLNDKRMGEGKPEGYNLQGSFLGTMADSDGGDVTHASPPESDRVTARCFGERVARCALRWKAGAERSHT